MSKNKIFSAEEWVRDQIHLVSRGQDVPTLDFFGSTINIELPRVVTSIEAAQHYYDFIASRDPEFPRITVRESEESRTTTDRPYRWRGLTKGATVTFSRGRGGCDELLLLHEAAHVLSNGHHGPKFVGAYLTLVEKHIGPGVKLLLTAALNQGKRNEGERE